MDKKVRAQDDLYNAINGEWLKNAVIPEDKPVTGGFYTLDEEVEKTMMADFKAFAEGSKTSDIPEMAYAISLYKKVLDTEKRNEEGIEPVLPLLNKIKALETVEDLNNVATEFLLKGIELPIDMSVNVDMLDTSKYCFAVQGPEIILPDTTYYADDNDSGKQLLSVYIDMAKKALEFTPLSNEEKKLYIEDTIAYDALIAKKVKSQLEWSRYYENQNPMDIDEVAEYVAPFDIKAVLRNLYGEKVPSTLIVYDPKAIKEMSDYFSKENFNLYKHWLYVKTLLTATSCLSLELKSIGTSYRRALLGVDKDPVLEKQAYYLVSALYDEPVGVYYGRTYFGEDAKKDVVDIAQKVIDTYKIRMSKNAFLADSTKQAAIKKLSAIVIKMGYPDTIREIWKKLKFEENDSLFESVSKIQKIRKKDEFDKLYKEVDRSEWGMPGHMVNACYSSNNNDITFPAAILQKPFYSLSQSVSENLGGIGAIIGHEISHAFDTNGARFDEKGNMKNWWLEDDFKAFENLSEEMKEQYEGIPYHDGKVNGELTVSENIADNGGMGVTLEIMHTISDANFKAYFENWARIWCMKFKEEMIQYLLANDVHSPSPVRANMPPRNFSEWYEAFGVTDKDEMYIAPEKRISIW